MLSSQGFQDPSLLDFTISNALDTPQVRDRLEKGVKLHELANLKKFFEDSRAAQLVRKSYGYLIQDMEFLQTTGAMRFPERPSVAPISTVRHWVAIRGYYKVDPVLLASSGVEHRVIINTASLNLPVLIMDADAWRLYYLITKYSRGVNTREQIFTYLLYVLDVLKPTQLPFGVYVDEGFVKWMMFCKDYNDIAEQVCGLSSSEIVADSEGILQSLVDESFCMPSKTWIFSDGLYFQITVPSWTLSSRDGIDYTGNYITDWDFFVATE